MGAAVSRSPFIRTTPPEALVLHVTSRDGRQAAIENDYCSLEHFDSEYVNFSGFFGTHNPDLFAAAPELRSAVTDVTASLVAAISILRKAHEARKDPGMVVASTKMFQQMLKDYEGSVQRARAAIAKATGAA